jgi:hypothetical protein
MRRPHDLYTLGLNMCGLSMLAALAAGIWGYFMGVSTPLLIVVALIAFVGICGITVLMFDFTKSGDHD